MAQAKTSPEVISALLKSREENQESPGEDVLVPVYAFLSDPAAFAGQADSQRHWLCPKTPSSVHVEAATYLLFLFAFDLVGTAKDWIIQLEDVLSGCELCARDFGAARRTLGAKYLSRYPAKTKIEFFNAIDNWLSTVILKSISSLAKSSYSVSAPSILSIPPAMFQLLLGEPSMLQREEMSELMLLALEEQHVAPALIKTAAASSLGLTAGLAFLLQSSSPPLRAWAIAQLPGCARRPLSCAEWMSHGVGTELQAMILSSSSGQEDGAESRWEAVRLIIESGTLSQEALEKGLLASDKVVRRAAAERGIVAVLANSFFGQTQLFPLALKIFTILLDKSPTYHIWASDPSTEWPMVVLSDLLDNTALESLLRDPSPLVQPLDWLGNFLRSVHSLATRSKSLAFSEGLAKVLGFCFASMQHVRFEESVKARVAQKGMDALSQLHSHLDEAAASGVSPNDTFHQTFFATLDIHAATIVAIALRPKAHAGPEWVPARAAARDLLAELFEQDGRNIDQAHTELAEISHGERYRSKKAAAGRAVADPVKLASLPTVWFRQSLWVLAYDELGSRDVDGVSLFMRATAPFAHLELLDRSNAWNQRGLEAVIDPTQWITSVRTINKALKLTRESFAPALESLASHSDAITIRQLWSKPNASEIAIRLLLSPVNEVHDPVISLIQHSFDDVDDRADCFRCLLRTSPDQAMDGLAAFLRTFISVAQITPESCSLAKWMVRCFTDILDALCSVGGGEGALLQNEEFLGNHSGGRSMMRRVATLWSLMTEALALVFKRTATWAPYYENEVMVDWMRDALIFGRHMTQSMRAFESAALGNVSGAGAATGAESPARMTVVGQKMVRELEKVLRDLVSWIRLTDQETLHQTFELVKTLLERINRSRNSKSSMTSDLKWTIEEIDKFCRRDGKAFRSRLSDDLLSELSDLIAPFDETLDEIQFIKSTGPATLNVTDSLRAKKRPAKNAFDLMMPKSSRASYSAAPSSKAPSSAPHSPIDVDSYDDFFDEVSVAKLVEVERRAFASQNKPKRPVQPPLMFTKLPPGVKNPVLKPKPKPLPAVSGLKTKVMKDLRREHTAHLAERRKLGPVITPRAPPAPVGPNKVLAPTGIARKDPPKAIAPIDSGSSASDSSDEDTGTITALTKLQKSPARPAPEKRHVKVLQASNVPNLTARGEQRQNAHRTRLRLRPDMGTLHRHVLTWDPDFSGALAPQSTKLPAAYALPPMLRVPRAFKDAAAYEAAMLPLFIQEQWAAYQKERDFPDIAINVEVSNRFYVDEYVDLELTMTGEIPFTWRANESDVVVLRRIGGPGALFAKVQIFRRKFKEINMTLRVHSTCDVAGLAIRSKWQLRKSFSLGTAAREFAALKGMPYYEDNLARDIIAARCAEMPTFSTRQVTDAMEAHDVNEPQAKAILGAMQSRGFVLIQGPPGTGKTKTISGLVGKFLSERAIPINSNRGEKPSKDKLLVCAPSNAAIDEVARRLKDGVRGSSGELIRPNIIRIGHDNTVNVSAKDIALDYLVEQRVNADLAKNSGGTSDAGRIQADLDQIKQQSESKAAELSRVRDNDAQREVLEAELHALRSKRIALGQAFTKAKDEARAATRHLDGARRAAREKILAEADIICCTLSGAGQESIASFDFGTVIIDEAAQAIEISTLIPLKYRCTRCIMVGDPKQLPPTVLSPEAQNLGYNQSLFVRIAEQHPAKVHLLSIQYRMHPQISQLPSKVFYESHLLDGPNMAKKTAALWHSDEAFGPYRFFNVEGQETQGSGTSTKNPAEALVAVDLFRRLEQEVGLRVNLDQRIGVITMYKDQLAELKRSFTRAFGESILTRIDFQTVDGFQGQEKDIIILSCVRSGPNLRSIGFLKDERRMNVALTRAKSSLFIIGNAATLERSDEKWRTIVGDARSRGHLINHDSATFAGRPAKAMPIEAKVKPKKPTPTLPDLLPPKAISAQSQKASKPRIDPRIGMPTPTSSSNDKKRSLPAAEAGPGAVTEGPKKSPDSRDAAPAAGPVPKKTDDDLFRQKKKKKHNTGHSTGPTGIKQHIHDMTTGKR